MADPVVGGKSDSEPAGERAAGAHAGAAVQGAKEPEDAEVIEEREARGNPPGGGGGRSETSPLMGIVEDLVKAGGQELWKAATEYVREGNLSLFRSNPSESKSEGKSSGTEEKNEGRLNPHSSPPEIPNLSRRGGASSPEEPSAQEPPEDTTGTQEETTRPLSRDAYSLSSGDIARVSVGNAVAWVKVTGLAQGQDDYKGRLEEKVLNLPSGEPVTFAASQVLGKVGKAPKNPSPGPPEGIGGRRTRDNPAAQNGPLDPRF